MSSREHRNGSMWLGRSYNVQEYDPAIDDLSAIYRKRGRIKEGDLAVLTDLYGNTVKNCFGGKTRQPRHSTLAKLGAALGCEWVLQEKRKPDFEAELPKAKQQFKDHRAMLAKSRKRKR